METNLGIADAMETTASSFKGENKAPTKRKSRRRKHSLKSGKKPEKKTTEKKRPKYFVQF